MGQVKLGDITFRQAQERYKAFCKQLRDEQTVQIHERRLNVFAQYRIERIFLKQLKDELLEKVKKNSLNDKDWSLITFLEDPSEEHREALLTPSPQSTPRLIAQTPELIEANSHELPPKPIPLYPSSSAKQLSIPSPQLRLSSPCARED
jgi:hypothetical protein